MFEHLTGHLTTSFINHIVRLGGTHGALWGGGGG